MKKLTLALIVLLVSPALWAAEKATFHFGSTRFEVTDMLAYRQGGGDKPATVILMADVKIDRAAVAKAIHPEDALFAQVTNAGKANLLVVTLSEPGRCDVAAFLGESQQQIGLSDAVATIAKSDASRVAGACFMKEPGKSFDDAYDFRLPFDLALTAFEKPSPLPAGGGEPGEAFVAVVRAIEANDWKVARRHLREREITNEPKPAEMADFFQSLALNYPKSATVTGGLIKGDLARVEISGSDYEGKKIEGYFTMKKVAGSWRVVEQYLHYAY